MKRNGFMKLLYGLPFIGILPAITKKPIRVGYNEGVFDSIERIPFLKRFTNIVMDHDFKMFYILDRGLINKYMGYEHIKYQSEMTSESINTVLAEAQRRGDI